PLVQKRTHTGQSVLDARNSKRGPVAVIVLAAHRQPESKTNRHNDAGRPDLNVEFDRLARDQRLDFIMRVIRPGRGRSGWIKLAGRSGKPADADGRAWIVRAMEGDLLAPQIENSQHQEKIGIGRGRREHDFGGDRTGDLSLLREGSGEEEEVLAHRLIGQAARSLRFVGTKRLAVWMQIKFCPERASKRPFPRGSRHKPIDVSYLQENFRLCGPARILAFEKMAEKPLLQAYAVVCIEVHPVRLAMHFEPFLLRRAFQISLEIASRVQALTAPIC